MAFTPTTSEVYDAIFAYFNAQTYPLVTFTSNPRTRTQGATQKIMALELNEVSSTFGPARNKREDRQDHTTWTWEVQISFQVEVDFTNLRTALSHVLQIGNARAKVDRAKYIHPPRQDASVGSRAEFLLTVLPHPV